MTEEEQESDGVLAVDEFDVGGGSKIGKAMRRIGRMSSMASLLPNAPVSQDGTVVMSV